MRILFFTTRVKTDFVPPINEKLKQNKRNKGGKENTAHACMCNNILC